MGGSNAAAARTPPQAPTPTPQDAREIRCAQAYNKDIYVGCSDGTLIRYSVRDDDSISGDPYTIASLQSVPGSKAVDDIALVPALSKALVLSGGIIHFYTLPAFDPLPPSIISPLRGVITFAIDETAVRVSNSLPPNQPPPPIRLCVIRRRTVVVYALRDRLAQVKDIPFPNGALKAKLSGSNLCLADTKSYWMVNIDAAEALELMDWFQDYSVPEGTPPTPGIRPHIVLSDASEFMILMWAGHGCLGLFMTGAGNPTRGTLEYPQHPLSICIDFPYVAALLPNQTIEIHNILTLTIVAVIPCPTTLEASLLSHSLIGYLVPSTQRNSALKLISVPLISPPPPPPKPTSPTRSNKGGRPASPPSGSGLTPPPTPGPPPSFSRSSSSRSAKSSLALTRSGTLISGRKGIHSLLPSTLVSQIDSLLESARLDDAVELVQQTREKLDKSGSVDEGSIRELNLIHQRIAYQFLQSTRFEDAGKHFLAGEADPRILIRLFPDLRGNLITDTDEIQVFSGVAEKVKAFDSVDAIVMANLVRNYHPHIKPSVEEAAPTAELRRVLNMTARDMLMAFLKKVRGRTFVGDEQVKIKKVVDTTLLKLYAEEDQIQNMMTLIESSDNIVVVEVDALLMQQQRFAALSKLYQKRGDDGKLLEIWTKMVDGGLQDTGLTDPLRRVINLLSESKDRVLIQRYGIWLIRHDPAAALDLFISKEPKRAIKMDEALILRAIRAADPLLGERYLEHLVITRRSADPGLHTQLASSYLDRLASSLQDPETLETWDNSVQSYASRPSSSTGPSAPSIPFLAHLASLPESSLLTSRVKLVLFLQGSSAYDVSAIAGRLQKESDGSFPLEKAIVHGKMENHEAALAVLVGVLRDSTTADVYCTLGGDVIPGKVAASVGQQMGLEPWGQLAASAVASGSGFISRTPNGTPSLRPSKAPVAEEKKRELLGILMKVYMKRSRDTAQETAELLNAQAMNLDVLQVLDSVPPAWSLGVISSFLSRSLRRTLHEQQEGLITKAIAAGQNLQVSDIAHEIAREQGAMIEEPLDTDSDSAHEKDSFDDEDEEYISEKTPYSPDHAPVQPIPIPLDDLRVGSVDSSRTPTT